MIYLLSKLLPLALLPLGFSLILLLVGLIGRWRWPVIEAVALLWVCSLGLVSQILWRWLEAPWQRTSASEAPSAEAIVVLSGGRHPAPGAAQVSEWHDPDRFLEVLDDEKSLIVLCSQKCFRCEAAPWHARNHELTTETVELRSRALLSLAE